MPDRMKMMRNTFDVYAIILYATVRPSLLLPDQSLTDYCFPASFFEVLRGLLVSPVFPGMSAGFAGEFVVKSFPDWEVSYLFII
jgi:hypothetical protein